MSNNTQPEIRFPGFMEDWEERKLNELAEFNPKSDLPERFEYVDLESVVGTELVRHRTENRYSAPSRAQRLAKKNDVFYQTVRPYQKNNYLFDLPYDNYVFSTGYAQMRPIGNGYFLLTLIQEEKFVNRVLERSTGTSYPAINSNDLAKLPVKVPADIQEQQKVGTFFKQIDNTITLHQRKLDLLKETKKGFLQKMFPKNGAKVPEIRFPGFTEDWEERRLQEVVDRYDNLRIPITASKRVAGNTPYYGANGIQGYVEGYTHDGEFILVAEDGANDLKNYPVQYVDGKVWVNNHAHVIQAKENLADNMFLMNAIRSINIEPFLVGGGRAKLNADVLMKLEVIIPLKSEQQKIGAFFKQLDDTIALHQRKLDLLKETKKGFLQKMFV
ncbi:restriction endonuclease subunit S [Enterococcus hirae]|uniref:restriction endonuclease subunit S n=1 Tax=Enterococcus hirae TaxID=1354 RepID=UPI0019FC22A7|nr:restriction endonuclease subunit S [Enterococcus hirae]EMF0068393.1 restriction endonuclease subunit S [Enterococcus hirae]MCA6767431.1 restriction endonuclease subunit S [Enterococcus hirae]